MGETKEERAAERGSIRLRIACIGAIMIMFTEQEKA
jgi:hypothetical protein